MNLLQSTPLDWRPLYRLKVQRCPVCGHKDNCSGARDESGEVSFVYCRRPSENRTGLVGKPGRDGGMTFVLNPRGPSLAPAPRPVVTHKPEPRRADVEHAHGVYSALLDSLVLRDEHRAKMMGRGLSGAEIGRLVLRSAPRPEECGRIGDALASRGLEGVAGFYRARGRWFLRDLGAGVLIPVKDSRGRVRGLLLRRDEGSLRYVWLSTPPDKFSGGASTGAPPHFARCNRIRETGQALITEGALKASVISYFLDAGVIGVAGTASFTEDFGVRLREELPELRQVTLAYDADWQTKPEVRKALYRLQRSVARAGLRWKVRLWPQGKGYDDYLLTVARRREEVGA
jgi:DNA primase